MSTAFRFTVDEYDQMIAGGVFAGRDDVRVELLYGEVIEMNPPNPPHDFVIDLLTYWSVDNTSRDSVWVRIQNSLGLSELDSVPEPDVAWMKSRNYRDSRPTSKDVLLLIEVAESSIGRDRIEKGRLYADAGIEDYWIVNLNERCVEVYRNPSSGRFQSLSTHGTDDIISPLAAPHVQLQVSTLFD